MAASRSPLLRTPSLVEALCCPLDRGALETDAGGLVCPACGTHFPVREGIVSFLSAQDLSEQDHRERMMRDEESVWYDRMFQGYTNAVEVPAAVRGVNACEGVVLDAGCGTGRITEALVARGRPIIAVDYSEACLKHMLARTEGAPVLAVQSDIRHLPVKDGVAGAATCIETYSQFRPHDRARVLAELRRALAADGTLSISTFNYNVVFRIWSVLGNEGARQGEHMLGGDYHYQRFTKSEFRRELEAQFDVEELTAIRNIPARSIAGALAKLRLHSAGDRFLRFMTERGHAADFWLEGHRVADLVGFFWQATCRPKAGNS